MADEYIAYCLREREKHPMKEVHIVTNDKGRRMAKGICTSCGSKVTLILPSVKN